VTRDRALLFAAFVWLAATAWLLPLAIPDEGRYVGVAWEMLRSGDWLVPTLDGLPYFHKPPLFYWLTAAALSVGDSSLLAARVAPWLGACLAALSLFLFARRWAGPARADAALFALVTAPLFYFGAQYANLDMLVAGCITATILAFAHAVLLDADSPERRRALLAAYAFCALGVLAKGLIGIVLPGMVLFLWLVWERRWMAMLRLLWLPGIALFFAIAAPWFVLMQQRFDGFAHYFFVVQHFQRYAEAGFNNVRPFWFYPAVLLVGCLPWTIGLASAWRLDWRSGAQDAIMRRLMLVWIVAITLFFSLPRSKLPGYIFPVAAPLLYVVADALRSARARRVTLSVAGALCLALAVVFAVFLGPRSQPETDIGHVLRDQMQSGDTVIALDEYRFAVPVVARLRRPVIVVADWTPAEVAKHDNWRKELADAAVFAPRQDWLIPASQLPARVCASQTAWLIGTAPDNAQFAWIAQAERVAVSGKLVLWRVDAASPVRPALCPGTPSASSGGK
jgi:4-amino-4-deoxy-L-arabinose transferase-like glycosyltransferase